MDMLSIPTGVLLAAMDNAAETISAGQWWLTGGVILLLLAGMLAFTYTTKAGILARAATKEAIRQPIFFLLLGIALLFLVVNTYLPFFSLGEDVKMTKDCGLMTILFCCLLFTIKTSSTLIAEEIEGKTAMTLLSKPINRRQFIVGKYIGILQAVLLMLIPLVIIFLILIYYKVGYDAREATSEAPEVAARIAVVIQILPGLILIFLETAVLAAISVAISTRLPMMVNIVICMSIFVIGHLTPVLVKISTDSQALEYVQFMAQLIATVLPSLEVFNMQAAVATERIVPPDYLGLSAVYCAAYCSMAILFAFILFEDRDLA